MALTVGQKKASSCVCYVSGFLICVLLACSFSSLHPLEYGIEFNNNEQALRPDRTYKGGRWFLGLGHRFVKFPGRRILLVFTDDKSWWEFKDWGWYVYVYDPVQCRSGDGLNIVFKAVLSMSIGKGPFTKLENGTIPKSQRESLNRFYLMFGGPQTPWVDQIYLAAMAAMQDEAAKHLASDFYMNRGEIGASMTGRVNNTLREIELTLMDLNLVNIDYPKAFSVAIQETELAKQENKSARFDQGRRMIEARTLTAQAEVFASTLNYTAVKKAEVSFLERGIYAYLLGYVVTSKGEAFEAARAAFKAATNSTGVDYANDDLLTFVWLMALMDSEAMQAGTMLLDGGQPFDFADLSPDDEDGLDLDAARYFERMRAAQSAADARALEADAPADAGAPRDVYAAFDAAVGATSEF